MKKRVRLAGFGGAGLLAVGGLLAVARRRLVIVEISGTSMSPTYEPGDRVLVLRRRPAGVGRGQVVVAEAPTGPAAVGSDGIPLFDAGTDGQAWFIKRVAALPGDPVPTQVAAVVGASDGDRVPPGRLVLFGDNPRSADSRTIGYFSGDRLLGVVVRRLGRRTVAAPAAQGERAGAGR